MSPVPGRLPTSVLLFEGAKQSLRLTPNRESQELHKKQGILVHHDEPAALSREAGLGPSLSLSLRPPPTQSKMLRQLCLRVPTLESSLAASDLRNEIPPQHSGSRLAVFNRM